MAAKMTVKPDWDTVMDTLNQFTEMDWQGEITCWTVFCVTAKIPLKLMISVVTGLSYFSDLVGTMVVRSHSVSFCIHRLTVITAVSGGGAVGGLGAVGPALDRRAEHTRNKVM